MKRIKNYLWMLLAVLFVGCSSDVDLVDDYSPLDENIESIEVIARDFEFVNGFTRTSIDVGNSGVEFEWEAADTIGIFPNQGYQVAFPMISGAGTQMATFSGGGWALKASSRYAAYYPFVYDNKDSQAIPISYEGQLQVGNADTQHIGLYDYMATQATTPAEGNVTFEFQHIGALLELNLIVPEKSTPISLMLSDNEPVFAKQGKVNLFANNLDIITNNKSKTLSIDLSDVATTADGEEITVYMMVPPTTPSDDNLLVSLINNEGRVASATLEGVKFEAGKAYSFSITLDEFCDAALQIVNSKSLAIGAEGGTISLQYLSNIDGQVIIPEGAKDWIQIASTRALSSYETVLNIAPNTEAKNRTAIILVKDKDSDLTIEYGVIQGGVNSYAITKENPYMPIGVLTGQYLETSASHGLAALIDNNTSTYYEVATNESFYIEWEGPFEIGTKNFGFDGGPVQKNRAAAVSISVSKNGRDWNGLGWSILDPGTYINTQWIWSEVKASAKAIRMMISGNNGGSVTQVSEFQIFLDERYGADILTLEDLIYRGSSFTHSDNTPMGNHYAYKHVTTDSDRAWLANAANEPALLPSAPGYTLRPYKVTLYPSGTPLPSDANQHGVGDCSAVAVLAELAYLFPDFIKSIITDHGDGTFTVAMYDPQGKPVNVRVQSTFLGDDGGLGAASGKNGEATWATVMEKAIMKWNYIYQVNPDIYGIGSEHVAPLFTGNGDSFGFGADALSAKHLKQAVDVALANNMIVIGGFLRSDYNVGYGPQTVSAHAYSFMHSYDPEALFAMRNPWGYAPGGNNKDDGLLRIYDDGVIPQLIDIRIIYPGAAAAYAVDNLQPYVPITLN